MTQIRRDLSDLPAASTDAAGRTPDSDPWVGRQLGEAFLAKRHEASKAHAVPGTRFRFSMAGSCTRAIAYYVAGTAESNPATAADAWRMQLGTEIHELLQAAVLDAFPEAEIEVVCQLPEIDGSGHIDIVIRQPLDDFEVADQLDDPDRQGGVVQTEKVIAIEVKTINGFGFKSQATFFKGPPKGPKPGHLGQAALGAAAIGADELIVVYLAMENVGPTLVRYTDDKIFGRFTAQWTYDRAEFMAIADREKRRVRYVLDKVPAPDGAPSTEAAAKVPAYVDNDFGVAVQIMPPGTGQTVTSHDGKLMPEGSTWHCDYCRWKDQCKADG